MKKNLKYIYYAFFVLAILFIGKGIKELRAGEETYYMSFIFSFILIVYGLFRLRYWKKFNEYHKNKNNQQ
ncbi:MAG: hypothetical protein HRT68_00720 [Flavobacteriaceae bacterium]|nr:hypothetical protein [Flavobacteriaceae bacterium]